MICTEIVQSISILEKFAVVPIFFLWNKYTGRYNSCSFHFILFRVKGKVIMKGRSVVGKSSAPGKAILFGEQAVVHGATAMAAAVSDLRIEVDLVSSKDFTYVNHSLTFVYLF